MEQQAGPVRTTYQEKRTPTPTQERELEAVLWRCRTLSNTALEQRRTWWRRGQGKSASRWQQEAELQEVCAAFPEYAALHRHVVQDVLARLDKASQAFFRRVEAGQTPGFPRFPRFQGSGRYHSFPYKAYGNGARLENGYLVRSTIGRLAVRWSRSREGTPKTVTLTREADGWYVCCSCAEVPLQPLPETGRETGIAVGLTVFLITADGVAVANPRHHRQAEQALAKAQRRASRRQQGSNRRKQAVQRLAKQHQHVRRQRCDLHQKTACTLVHQYDVISCAAIQPATLSRRPAPVADGNGGYRHTGAGRKAGRNKSIHDAGWGQFLRILACTAAGAGKRVEAVPPAYTSQDWSGCGQRVPKSLSVRTQVCPSCGFMLDRDENAARNIQWRGQRLRGVPALAGAMNREPARL